MTPGARRICLVGVRGIGKSSMIREVAGHFPSIDHIIGSSVLQELAGPDFEHFDYLPPLKKHAYRVGVIEWMEQRQAKLGRHILCEGHTVLFDESTKVVGPVFTPADCHFYRELILMDSAIEMILARRQADTSKLRCLDPKIIAKELAGERTTSELIAQTWGMKLHRLPIGNDSDIYQHFREILAG